jgi:hypothetical protein
MSNFSPGIKYCSIRNWGLVRGESMALILRAYLPILFEKGYSLVAYLVKLN